MLASLAGASACDKVPLLAPTGSTITLNAAQLVLPVNGSTELIATVIEGGGQPVQNGTLVTFTTTLGTIEPREARTSAGQVTVRFNSGGQSGTAEIRALSGGASVKDALKIDIGAAVADSIQITATPGNIPSTGGSAQIVATVTDKNGNRVPGVPVGFSSDAGILSTSNAITDANGQASTTLTTTKTTKVTARAGSKTADVSVTLNTAPGITIKPAPAAPVVSQPVAFTIGPVTSGAILQNVRVDFGDGTSQTLVNINGDNSVSHTYCSSGTFQASVTGTDINGERANASASVVVAPLAVSVTSATGTTNRPVAFTATPSNGAIVTRYDWDFGDGQRQTTAGPTVVHTYQVQGGYEVKVTAFGLSCGVATAQTTAIITP